MVDSDRPISVSSGSLNRQSISSVVMLGSRPSLGRESKGLSVEPSTVGREPPVPASASASVVAVEGYHPFRSASGATRALRINGEVSRPRDPLWDSEKWLAQATSRLGKETIATVFVWAATMVEEVPKRTEFIYMLTR